MVTIFCTAAFLLSPLKLNVSFVMTAAARAVVQAQTEKAAKTKLQVLQEQIVAKERQELLSETSGVIAYKLTEKGTSHGREFTSTVYASAVWVQRDGKWLCVFSQETPAR